MNSQTQCTDDILVRVEKLERENRRLKRIGISVVLICSMVLLMGQAKVPTSKRTEADWEKRTIKAGTIQASRIELVTSEGKLRAVLNTFSGASEFHMFDQDGNPRVSVSAVGPALHMGDLKFSDSRFSWLASERQSATLATFTPTVISLMHGKQRIDMGVSAPENGGRGFGFFNVLADDATVRVGRTDGYYTAIGSTDLVTTATGESHKTSPASIVLFNDKGNAIWRVP